MTAVSVPAPAADLVVTVPRPWMKPVRAAGSWQGSMTTEVQVRKFSFRTDEPIAVGGTNQAPTPMEVVAGAVNGCITVVIETVAKELGVRLQQVETESIAFMDSRGFHGTADVSPHFHEYTLRIRVVTPEPKASLAGFREQAEKRCPALNLLRDAGVPVDLLWEFSVEPFPAVEASE